MSQRVICALGILLLLSSCASAPPPSAPVSEAEAETMSFIYGYLDMKDAPSDVKGVWMQRMRPIEDLPYFGFGVHDGYFYRPNVPNGAYKFTEFRGNGFLGSGLFIYSMQGQGKGDLDREINKPSFYFVGAWKYKAHKKGWFEQDEFELLSISAPSERQVLEKILLAGDWDRPSSRVWRKKVEKRLAELKKCANCL
ncbi:MAG: hypothetical protein ACREV9_04245 [Burkholderiales bacterium]